jgi:prepilin-type processing-associated H-X9-DG protein
VSYGRKIRLLAAFSLLELLVVVAIALLLTTMYWGANSGSRVKEQRVACQNTLQKLLIGAQIYSNDQNGRFPAVKGAKTAEEPMELLVPKYNADLNLFICPGTKDDALPSGEPLTKHKISYAYYMGRHSEESQLPLISDRQVDTTTKTSGQNLFSSDGKPPGNNHEKSGGNVLFCDGRAEYSPAKAAFELPLGDGVTLLNPKP